MFRVFCSTYLSSSCVPPLIRVVPGHFTVMDRKKETPKFKPDQSIIIHIRIIGGEACDLRALHQKVGKLGLPTRQLAHDLQFATLAWKGQKVTCKLTVQNSVAKIDVVPTAENLLFKALNMPNADYRSLGRNKGNLTFDQVIHVARQMRPRSMAKKLEGTVKEMLGTAQCGGYTVNGQKPEEIVRQINEKELIVPEE
ncbi:hypothetical protein L596_014008 [Steinernema carpocapsae]|uniref:Large ribosomal subunit protein uL11 C-terminal domain-containing protein n=1 Tax=Steinernema carpocapsae TaxID=34508 RepID=A0A4U5NA31_STECR|nr:hypothetical protein L596_014008 [Steinernema carpocapsae]